MEGLLPATIDGYSRIIKNHILPELGGYRIKDIKPLHIKHFYDRLQKKYSAKYIHNIHGVIHCAFEEAIQLQVTSVNPADAVRLPKYRQPDIKTATENEREMLLQAIEKSKYRTPILIALATGMRRGEILGLKWEDFNATDKTLFVRRSIGKIQDHLYQKSPKNGKTRIIPIGDHLIKILKEHRQAQLLRRLANPDYHDLGWICANDDGNIFTPGGFDRAYSRIKNKTGVSNHRQSRWLEYMNRSKRIIVRYL